MLPTDSRTGPEGNKVFGMSDRELCGHPRPVDRSMKCLQVTLIRPSNLHKARRRRHHSFGNCRCIPARPRP
jgi:hypothetical protein